MKKILAITLCLILALSMVACGSASSVATSTATSTAASTPASSIASADDAIAGPDDLTGKTIGVQLGTTGDIYASDIEGATIERYNKGFEAIQSLLQDKIDCVIIDDQPAKVFVEQNEGLKILDEAFTTEEYAICVSKDNTDLTEKMNAAIGELKADGTLQAILDFYIGGVEGATAYTSPEGTQYPNGKLIMATNAEFPPYEYHDDAGNVAGVDADFARAICDKMGYELEISDMAFDSIIAAVQTGKADFGAAGMTVTEDRLKTIDFTDSYCTATQVIIVKG